MLLEQLISSLPNGFHDAEIESIAMDYISRKAIIEMNLLIGSPDSKINEEREAYKRAELHLTDVLYIVIEAPDPNYQYAEKKVLSIDAGGAKEESAPKPPIPLSQLPAGVSAHWFFVSDWNSFIHLAALDATLHWT